MCQPNKNEEVRCEVESSFEGVGMWVFFRGLKVKVMINYGKVDKLTCLDDMLQFQHYAVQSQ